MKIKDNSISKIQNLFFKRVYTNSIMLIIITGVLFNYVFQILGNSSFNMLEIYIGILSFSVVSLLAAIGPGEALRTSYSNDHPEDNLSDIKKSIIYFVVYSIVVMLWYIIDAPQKPIIKHINIHKKVTHIKVIDLHEDKEDSYAIAYLDKDNNVLFRDVYKKEADRIAVINKIYNKNNKIKVSMDFYNKDGTKCIEITLLNIKLKD